MRMEPIKVQSLENSVYDSIKKMIVGLELRPGETLNIASLAAQLDVSITPVRAALQLLEREDLVSRVHNRGFSVAPLTEADAANVYEMRRALELLALETAVDRIDREALAKIVEHMRELRQRREGGRDGQPYDLDYSLHDLIVAASSNPYLQRTYDGLMSNIQRYRNVLRMVGTETLDNWISSELDHHMLIGEYILSGDREKARAALERHLRDLTGTVVERLSQVYPILAHSQERGV